MVLRVATIIAAVTLAAAGDEVTSHLPPHHPDFKHGIRHEEANGHFGLHEDVEAVPLPDPPAEEMEKAPNMQVDWGKAFPKIDEDGDSLLTKHELVSYLKKSHARMAWKHRDAVMTQVLTGLKHEVPKLDKNKDGKLDIDEIVDPKMEDVVKQKELRLFDLADRNGDGFLSADELVIRYHPDLAEDKDKWTEIQAEDWLAKFDTDANGSVNTEEYESGAQKDRVQLAMDGGGTMGAAGLKLALEQDKDMFTKMDDDNNGEITFVERKAYLVLKREKPGEILKDSTKMVEAVDQDGDGKIDQDELEQQFHLVVAPHLHDHFNMHAEL
jgi:Ca2+-binding EF-hand superfamily protein